MSWRIRGTSADVLQSVTNFFNIDKLGASGIVGSNFFIKFSLGGVK